VIVTGGSSRLRPPYSTHVERLPRVTQASLAELISGFVPTPRFAHVAFETYRPEPRFPSQRTACERMRAFGEAVLDAHTRRRGLAGLLRRRPLGSQRAVYLDGGYGVGKTHLLAATHRVAPEPKSYLSFSDLTATILRMGMTQALAAFKYHALLCIDEFELDDVAQTRMAATFLRTVLGPGSTTNVVTTSNTLPTDLGRGRFASDAFQREIGEIASAFEIVSIEGEDYRHRRPWTMLALAQEVLSPSELDVAYATDPAPDDTKVRLGWEELALALAGLHPVQYGQVAAQLEAVYVGGLSRIDDQAIALRLVHFVDKLYDQQVRLAVSLEPGLELPDIFSPAYRDKGYEKKYRRCLSRLHELLCESASVRTA
jgi:cell division protein ZapE